MNNNDNGNGDGHLLSITLKFIEDPEAPSQAVLCIEKDGVKYKELSDALLGYEDREAILYLYGRFQEEINEVFNSIKIQN